MNSTSSTAGRLRVLPLLLLLFIGSGCAALIYEIVWFQLLQLVIGLTSVSLGLLLGMFMGGMCLGSLLLPRFIPVRCHPLRVYALLEIGIAITGLVILIGLPWVADIYSHHAGQGNQGRFLRAALAALFLLPPTVLMGATLPAAARWMESTREGVAWLGFFYGGNIAGAVAGCLLTGFYLLRIYDMSTATGVAVAINFIVAGLALLLARSASATGDAGSETSRSGQPASQQTGRADANTRWLPHAAIAVSGMTALGAEVVWTRLLSLLLGGTVYTFSIILAVFLAGLGIGSTAGSHLSRTMTRPGFALGICQILLCGCIAWSATMISSSLPYWPVDPTLSTSPWFNFQLDLARGLWAVLPAAILWGASFPLALAAMARKGADPAKLVGGAYASNTVGAILGALGFSLLVIPLVGTASAEKVLIALSAFSAVLAFAMKEEPESGETADRTPTGLGFKQAFCMSAPIAIAILLCASVGPTPWGLAAYGRFMATYKNRLAPGIVNEKEIPTTAGDPDIFCTYLGEGLNGTIAITRWKSGVQNFHSAGKVQASNDPRDMRLQRMLGHLSGLAHEKPESVLVVACGAGVTAGSFVTHPETKRIVICDIEPLVPKMIAPRFSKENFDVVNDPRTQVVSDDGRHFIRTTQEKFDIITSDPIDPWVKGCAALNTVEYYEMCKAHLKPGGVMSLWIPLYESGPETIKSVLATFFKVFPKGMIWSNDDRGTGYDVVLFGQVEGTRFDLDKLQARLDRPDHARVKQSLIDVGFPTAVDLLGTYAGQASDLKEWANDAQINTDGNLRLQYLAGWSFNSFIGGEILNGILKHRRFPEEVFVGSPLQKLKLRARLVRR